MDIPRFHRKYNQIIERSNVNEENLPANSSEILSDNELTTSQSSILVTEKGNLKWQRNFEDLKLAVDPLQIRAGNWSSSGGYCKLFENGEISIRWYTNIKTLTAKGYKVEEIKEKLLNFDRKLNVEATVYPESPKVTDTNTALVSYDRNLHSVSRCSS